MFRNDLYMHRRDSIRFALFLKTLDSRVRARGGARGQNLGRPIFYFFFFYIIEEFYFTSRTEDLTLNVRDQVLD